MTERERDESSGTILPPGAEQWIARYQEYVLAGKQEETIAAYIRILRQVAHWIAGLPENQGQFSPGLLTPETVTSYISEQADVYSPSHLKRVRSVLNGFCLWLIAQGELEIAPVRGISLPAKAPVSPGVLTQQQRETLSTLVERRAGLRGKAIFSLGYAAGCRVSEISHLLLEHTEANAREGRLRLGIPGRAERTIILAGEAREALYAYLISGKRAQSAYLFTSQRERVNVPYGDRDGWRLRESAIHAWFQELRWAAAPEEWELIGELTFHDLRRDFAFRARETGFSETELAAYLGLGHRPIAGDGAGKRREVDPEQLREKLLRLKSR
jgi:site-specific recombinase XerD